MEHQPESGCPRGHDKLYVRIQLQKITHGAKTSRDRPKYVHTWARFPQTRSVGPHFLRNRVDRGANRRDALAWRLQLQRAGSTVHAQANVIITAVGVSGTLAVRRLRWTRLPGTIVHPSEWSDGLDLSGRDVAIMGNGSTGVQLHRGTYAHGSSFSANAAVDQSAARYGAPVSQNSDGSSTPFLDTGTGSRLQAAAQFETHELMLPDPEDRQWRIRE